MVDRGALELQGDGRVQRLEAAARTTDDALRNRLVLPVGGRHDFALFPEQAADRTNATFLLGAEADFVALRNAVVPVQPLRLRGVALVHAGAGEPGALVVRAPHATRVVGVVTLLVGLAGEVSAAVHEVQCADLAVHHKRGVRELVVRVRVAEQVDLQLAQRRALHGAGSGAGASGYVGRRRAVRGVRVLVEHAAHVHLLIRLCEQDVPVVVDLMSDTDADALVVDIVDVIAGDVVVVDDERVRRDEATGALGEAEVRATTGEGARHVVDVAALRVAVDNSAQSSLLADGQVQHGRQVAVVRAVSSGAVTGRNRAFRHAKLRLVRDVTEHTRLGAGAEQGALRAFEHFDALQVRGVNVQVTARDAGRLFVEVNSHVRPLADGARTLRTTYADRQAAHVDVAFARTGRAERDVGQVLNEFFNGADLELAQGFAGERLDGDRHVLDVFRAALRGNDDFF